MTLQARVWNAVHRCPGSEVRDIAYAVRAPKRQVQHALRKLVTAGRLTVTQTIGARPSGIGGRGAIWLYRTVGDDPPQDGRGRCGQSWMARKNGGPRPVIELEKAWGWWNG